jgi:hypothetical protein
VKFAVDTNTGALVAMKVLDKATILDHHMLQQPPLPSHLIRSQFPVAGIQIKLLLLPLPSNPRFSLDPINFSVLLAAIGWRIIRCIFCAIMGRKRSVIWVRVEYDF